MTPEELEREDRQGSAALITMALYLSNLTERGETRFIRSVARAANTREKRAALLTLSTLLKAAWLENQ